MMLNSIHIVAREISHKHGTVFHFRFASAAPLAFNLYSFHYILGGNLESVKDVL